MKSYYLPTLYDRERVFDLLGKERFREILNLPLDCEPWSTTDYMTPFWCYWTNSEIDEDNAKFVRIHEDKVFFEDGWHWKTLEFDVRLFIDWITRDEIIWPKWRKKTKYWEKCTVYEIDGMIGIVADEWKEYYVVRSKNQPFHYKRDYAHDQRWEREVECEHASREAVLECKIKTLEEENKRLKEDVEQQKNILEKIINILQPLVNFTLKIKE